MHETSPSATAGPSNSTSPTSATSRTPEPGFRTRLTRTVPPSRWNDLCRRSGTATPFHRYEALAVLAERSGATLHPFVGYQDDRPVGLFPVFERSRGPVTTLFSPVPDLKVPYLGPVFLDEGDVSPAEREARHRAFVDAAVSCFEARFGPRYVHVRTTPRFPDPRPFAWRGFEQVPRHSYVVDLTPDREDLLTSFSSDARRNVRERPAAIEIRVGEHDAIERIVRRVRDRHEEQGETYLLDAAFPIALYDALPDGVVRPYEVFLDDRAVGGMITLEAGDTIYRWQGGAKPDVDAPVNDLLDWEIMRAAADRGIERYDLVGANEERLTRYKAKFAPELVTYHSLVRSTRPMDLASTLYKRLR